MKDKIESPAYVAKQAMPGQEQKAWNSLWTESNTFWDIGRAHPFLPLLLERVQKKNKVNMLDTHVYVPGCGRGHEAAYMASLGTKVTAIDYSPAAIKAAKNSYADVPGLTFHVADAFYTPPEEMETVDIIVDRAMLCAIEPSQRVKYLTACAQRLKNEGFFLSVAFHEVLVPNGPPFTISHEELLTIAGKYFDILHCESVQATTMTDYINKELLVILGKRSII